MKEHIRYLDGWRGLAIGAVLFSHFGPYVGIEAGRLGVDLFFVLSGLLMSRILYEQRVPLSTFYKRRASRILPVFFLFVAVMVIVAGTLGLRFLPSEILATLTFTRTYFPPDLPIWLSETPVSHLWSLNAEEHSYVLLATLAAIPFLRRREGILLIVLGIGTMLAFLAYRHAGGQEYIVRTECATTGLLLAAGYRQLKRHTERFVQAWMPIAALLLGVTCYINGLHDLLKGLVAPVLFAFAVNHIDRSVWMVRALETRAICMLGIWSYSIYIWQQPFCKAKATIGAPLALTLAILCGLASYYLYESPIRKWLNRKKLPAALPA